jgi:Pyruvate/2-oxoacid:ferredoxin oxidoreductase delta subunit
VHVRFEATPGRASFKVTPIADSDFSLDAHAIITAIGQDPDLAPLGGGPEIEGALLKVNRNQATPAEGVYAGGDVASMARFVTEAIGMGKRAAAEIDRVLRGGKSEAAAVAEPVVTLAAINTFYYPHEARVDAARLPAAERLAGDAEVQKGFDLAQTHAESERCFSCGTCIRCDNCVHYCPDLAVKRDGMGYLVLMDYCKGCGLCVKECPTASMRMIEEKR